MKEAYMWCDNGKHLTGYYILNSRRDKVCLACATLRDRPQAEESFVEDPHIAQVSEAQEAAFRKKNLFMAQK